MIEIWNEWSYNNNNQEQINKKWVNNIYNEKFRPSQTTKYRNLFLSGAHTQTTINKWSMEGAVESGKITANYILEKYNKPKIIHYKHTDTLIIKAIQYIDNILYKLYMPNIFKVVLLIILIIIILQYVKI